MKVRTANVAKRTGSLQTTSSSVLASGGTSIASMSALFSTDLPALARSYSQANASEPFTQT